MQTFYLQWRSPQGRSEVHRHGYTGNGAQAGHSARSWKIHQIHQGKRKGLRECREVGEAEWRRHHGLPRAKAGGLEEGDSVLRAPRILLRRGGFRGRGLFEDPDQGLYYLTQNGVVRSLTRRKEWALKRYEAMRAGGAR